MRYSVPVNAPHEVAALAAAGASELYCGYLDAWWSERYGDHDSASRRQGRANLSTPEELEATVRAARTHNLPIHLALNARYTEPQLDHLMELCAQFEAWGGTGIIVSDLGLLWRLNTEHYSRTCGLELTASLLTVTQNAETLKVYKALDVTRIVFPRFVGWQEAGAMLAAVPNMKASVMAFFDKCPLVDGYCRHRHGVSYPDRQPVGDDEDATPLYTFDTTYRTHACLGTSCTYLEPYPCAACHLRHFERAGVETAKLGGRGRPLDERLRALQFLREAEGLPSDQQRAELYEQTFSQRCACYYGPNTQARSAIEPIELPETTGGRVCIGSQTNWDEFSQALMDLCRGRVPACPNGLTLLVPPLAGGSLAAFMTLLPTLLPNMPRNMHIAVNDLGTLASLAQAIEPYAWLPVDIDKREPRIYPPMLTLGTLLARMDDPREVTHFLHEEKNPPRAVWDLEGRPRVLTYAPPTKELVRHWQVPSATEPSAQAALKWLFNRGRIPYEFEDASVGDQPSSTP